MNAPQQVPATGDHPVIPFPSRHVDSQPVTSIRLATGFTGPTISVAPEEQAAFDELRDTLFCSIRPKTGLEEEVFRHLLNAAWQLRRIARWEEELLGAPGNPFLDAAAESRLLRFQKYKASQERSFRHALSELRRLQTERLALTQTGDEAQAQLAANAPVAAVTRIAKASRTELRLCVPRPDNRALNATTFYHPPRRIKRRAAASAA